MSELVYSQVRRKQIDRCVCEASGALWQAIERQQGMLMHALSTAGAAVGVAIDPGFWPHDACDYDAAAECVTKALLWLAVAKRRLARDEVRIADSAVGQAVRNLNLARLMVLGRNVSEARA